MSTRSGATSTRPPARAAAGGRRRPVLCLENDGYEASLEPRKFYVALPDADAAARVQVRVVDESGEDYLYPAARFAEVPLPPGVRRRLLRAV
jgi:hypothetical protein